MDEERPITHAGSVVVVTGAASGIGHAAAKLAVSAGARVALLDQAADELKRVADSLNGVVVSIPCDVADEAEVKAAFAHASERLGAPTGLIASAGIDRGGLVHDLPADTWDQVMAVNLRGTFLSCREAIKHMIHADGGAIVCVSSPLGLVSAGGTAAYSASKAGIGALVRSLAVDYSGKGIRVNAVLPGPTETSLMWANVDEKDVAATRDTVRAEVPIGRLADPEEPARAALWLLSNDASYVTGAQLACDGGVLAKASISV